MFSLFSKFHNFGCKNNIDLWFSPNCSTDCALQNGFLNSTCKNRDLRLVLCRWVTYNLLSVTQIYMKKLKVTANVCIAIIIHVYSVDHHNLEITP